MSASPSRKSCLLSELARWLEVEQRTVRRWCEKGLVAGAYRTKNGQGQWRLKSIGAAYISVDKLPKGMFRRRDNASKRRFRESVGKHAAAILQKIPPNYWKNFRKTFGTAGDFATSIYFAHKYGVDAVEMFKSGERLHDPELRYEFNRLSLAELYRIIPAEMWKVAHNPLLAKLYLATLKLRFKQLPLMAKQLASELKLSRASLYRKYTSAQIQCSLDAVRLGQANKPAATAHAESVRDSERKIRRVFQDVRAGS